MAFPIVAGVEFRAIADFPGYCVGDDGSVWSCLRDNGNKRSTPDGAWKRLKPARAGRGYVSVMLYKCGTRVKTAIHRIVLLAFVGPCPDGMESCHENGVRNQNNKGNLRWDTPKNNQADRKKHGTAAMPMGEQHCHSKMTDAKVIESRAMLAAGVKQAAVAKLMGVDYRTINAIALGQTWKHLLPQST